MSVIRFSKEEVALIAKSLQMLDDPFDLGIKIDHEVIDVCYDGNKADFVENRLFRFVQRLFIANQVAYMLQYRHNHAISSELEILESDDLKFGNRKLMSVDELLKELNSIYYNVFTNDGNYVLSKPDEEMLESIIGSLKDKKIEKLEVKP